MAGAPADGYACPRCGKAVARDARWRPFCGERCKNVDLGAWWLGHYRVPAAPVSDEEAPKEGPQPPAPDDDDDAR